MFKKEKKKVNRKGNAKCIGEFAKYDSQFHFKLKSIPKL